MVPCSLTREPRLYGSHLAQRLALPDIVQSDSTHRDALDGSMSTSPVQPVRPASSYTLHSPPHPSPSSDFWTSSSGLSGKPFQGMHNSAGEGLPLVRVHANVDEPDDDNSQRTPTVQNLSRLEILIVRYEPILQTLLAFLPTSSVYSLYQTSRCLRDFLTSYPLAWKTLSYRLPQPTANMPSPGMNSPDQAEWQSRQFAFDLVLKRVVVPIATRLTSLDLCNTSVAGGMLVGCLLEKRKETLQHISVRGCKNVSLKYHIVPFLHQCMAEMRKWGTVGDFALRSLYTYRCRHHRRRPYLPSSLQRRDSDSEPTHDLIELCHRLGIWTDTAWCPTPGPRCFRRKDYHGNRAGPGTMEVWVPFDRLWRSSNRVGPAEEHTQKKKPVGKLWEEIEQGHDGQPLGTTDSSIYCGEGKDTPTHLRKSHVSFVDNIKCDECEAEILERCETCSIRMHCMGCRKTLCASCAFNRPLKKTRSSIVDDAPDSPNLADDEGASSRRRRDKKDRFWWAPGATKSPNLMSDDAEEVEDAATPGQNPPGTLKLNMSWCCLEPMFSGGGGVAFVGAGLAGHGSERIRAVPLPQIKEYIDPEFMSLEDSLRDGDYWFPENRDDSSIDILPYLQQKSLDLQAKNCPRCLCKSCYESSRWKVECKACKRSICKEHDFRALKIRKCGFRDLVNEREYVRNPPKHAREDMARVTEWPRELQIPEFRPHRTGESSKDVGDDERRPRDSDVGESQEWSDAGSQADGPATRDPSSTPRATPMPHADRSSSVASRGDDSIHHRLGNMDLAERAVYVASQLPVVRGRSLSVSEISSMAKGKGKAISQPIAKERMLLPCNGSHPVQWQGCGAYLCQGTRAVGDGRGRCIDKGAECVLCRVYLCEVRFFSGTIIHN